MAKMKKTKKRKSPNLKCSKIRPESLSHKYVIAYCLYRPLFFIFKNRFLLLLVESYIAIEIV